MLLTQDFVVFNVLLYFINTRFHRYDICNFYLFFQLVPSPVQIDLLMELTDLPM